MEEPTFALGGAYVFSGTRTESVADRIMENNVVRDLARKACIASSM
jgi:hypothetical protein